MPMIPERAPIGDVVQGAVLQLTSQTTEDGDTILYALLPSTADVALPSDVVELSRGTWTIRYAVRLLEKPGLSIVPGLLALDYGDMLTGEDAWEFLLKKSNLYPRADVVGYRNDGVDDMLPVKRLDLALPIEVLAYADAQVTVPIASLSAVILPQTLSETERASLPPRLIQYLPAFADVESWQQHLNVNDDADSGTASDT
jgi:hypothetical protein